MKKIDVFVRKPKATRTRQRRAVLLALGLILAVLLAACGGNAATSNQPALPAVNNGEGAGEEGGVEAALVTYSDAAQGFSIGYPGPWSQDKSVTTGVKFVGGDDWLTLAFVTPPAGTDAMTYAQNDVANVSAAFPGFKQIDLKASTEVKGAVILGFTADGTSTVTGKAFTAHDEIYYIPLADGRIAVLTVAGPENHYDREGVRDIALTLRVTS
jgi:hypothetical protein